MKHLLLLCLVSFSVIFTSYSSFATKKLTLEERWKLEMESPQPIDEGLKRIMEDRHVIFVPGIANELFILTPKHYRAAHQVPGYSKLMDVFPGYYRTNMKVVQDDLGAKVTYQRLGSSTSIQKNAKILYDILKDMDEKPSIFHIAEVNKKKILFTHSKGAAESLYCILTYKDLILQGKVDRFVSIQGAIHGSPLAKSDGSGAWYQRGIQYVGSTVLADGLQSLYPENANRFFKDAADRLAAEVSKDEWMKISKSTFFVRSYQDPEKFSLGSRIMLLGANPLEKQNDALLHEEDQMLNYVHPEYGPLGTDLGSLVADHLDLVVDGVVSGTSSYEKEAFTRALFYTIYEDEILGFSAQ